MKIEKIIPIILVIVVIAGLGYFVYQYSSSIRPPLPRQNGFAEKEVESGEIAKLLGRLQEETKTNFSEMSTINFGWPVGEDEKTLAEGKEFGVKRISIDQKDQIMFFFDENGFAMNYDNIIGDDIFQLVSFRNKQIGCLIESGIAGYEGAEGEEWVSENPDKRDVKIKCGKLLEWLPEDGCKDSRGILSTAKCCTITEDFPNTCFIGACGCSMENSHEVRICDCGEGRCFDGDKCVEPTF
jgi:hypothetical protein